VKTFSAKPGEFVRDWFVLDADGQVLGRLATRVATVLRGKHKPVYTPHTDTGDFVIVINAEKVKLTGAKLDDKMYIRHSGYPGGLRQMPYRRLLEIHPERAIEKAVKGMLPHNTLGRSQLRKLKVYAGTKHPHASQKPMALDVSGPIPVTIERMPVREKVERKPKRKSAPSGKAGTGAPAAKKSPRKATGRKPAARKSSSKKDAP
jgi:large subunit ribosomal protein L13